MKASGNSALVIAVDGPSGSGKSSVARAVAATLGLRYLDTGAMYRAMTWWMLRHSVDTADPGAVAMLVHKPSLVVGTDPAAPAIHADGVEISAPIRTRAVTNAVSAVSAVPEVRERMVARQREIIGPGGIAVEGRDIGTAVAPDAAVKVFLTATAGERAQRRTKELAGDVAGGQDARGSEATVTVGTTHAELARRDELDSGRTASPLIKADDAVEIDTTMMPFDEVVEEVLRLVRDSTEGQGA